MKTDFEGTDPDLLALTEYQQGFEAGLAEGRRQMRIWAKRLVNETLGVGVEKEYMLEKLASRSKARK